MSPIIVLNHVKKKLWEDEEEENEIDFNYLYKEKLNEEVIKKIEIKKNEKEESKKYVENLDLNKETQKFNSIMKEQISKEYLIDIELNNPTKQKERIQNIIKISDQIFEEKTREEYVEQLIDLTENIKESTYYEIHHEPENFVSKDEIKNDSNLFIQGVMSSFLEQKGINNVIRKNSKNDNSSKLALQLIFNGEAFNQIINFHYSYGEQNDAIILNDEKYQKKFINEKLLNYARILNKDVRSYNIKA